MLLTRPKELSRGEKWTYEPKLNGYRALGRVAADGMVRLSSREGNNLTDRYLTVVRALPRAFAGHSVIVDGELVGFNRQKQLDFDELGRRNANVIYFVFDLLSVDGVSLMNRPLSERRERLEELYRKLHRVQRIEAYDDLDLVTAAVSMMGLEGVVAKRTDSIYKPGKRTRAWQKHIINPARTWRHRPRSR